MDKNLYKFGLDWLNGVLPVSDVWEVFQELEKFSSKLRFDRWELVNKGMYNYNRRFILDGKATIQLMYNPVSDEELFSADMNHNNSGVFFSISGDGIRYLHSLGGAVSALNKLLFYFYRNNFRASRFDVYCDILDSENQVVDLIVDNVCNWDTIKLGSTALTTNMRRIDKNFVPHPHVDVNGNHYTNVDIGNHGSNMGMFRCYNKLDELLTGRLQGISSKIIAEYKVSDYWYRLEYELHKEYAAQSFNILMENAEKENKLCFEDIFYSALSRFFNIVNVSSLSTRVKDFKYCVIWQEFLDFVCDSSIHLVQFAPVPYVAMSKSRLHNYIKKNSVFVYAILVSMFLDNKFARTVIKDGSDKFAKKKKYNELKDELDVPGWMDLFINTQFNRAENTIVNW